jgi:Histidine kinase-, DNA gyrase B-, and HSP90-like ATPase
VSRVFGITVLTVILIAVCSATNAAPRGVFLFGSYGRFFPPFSNHEACIRNEPTNQLQQPTDSFEASLLIGQSLVSTTSAGKSEAMVSVSVVDSGMSIPSDKLNELSKVFYTTKTHGTGLGLSIAKSIVETYGAKIWAENGPAGGAIFGFAPSLAVAEVR